MDELTGLLRKMVQYGEALRTTNALRSRQITDSARQAIALAEDLERQLAAAQAALKQIQELLTQRPSIGYVQSSAGVRFWSAMEEASQLCLANGTAALDAHDERVLREALEGAADEADARSAAARRDGIHAAESWWRDFATMLRDRAKGDGNG